MYMNRIRLTICFGIANIFVTTLLTFLFSFSPFFFFLWKNSNRNAASLSQTTSLRLFSRIYSFIRRALNFYWISMTFCNRLLISYVIVVIISSFSMKARNMDFAFFSMDSYWQNVLKEIEFWISLLNRSSMVFPLLTSYFCIANLVHATTKLIRLCLLNSSTCAEIWPHAFFNIDLALIIEMRRLTRSLYLRIYSASSVFTALSACKASDLMVQKSLYLCLLKSSWARFYFTSFSF